MWVMFLMDEQYEQMLLWASESVHNARISLQNGCSATKIKILVVYSK